LRRAFAKGIVLGALLVVALGWSVRDGLNVTGNADVVGKLHASDSISTEGPFRSGDLIVWGKGIYNDTLRANKGIYVGGTLVPLISGNSATLNFGAPGAVPGSVDLTITVTGAALGDQPIVGAPVTIGANYVLTAFVSAANTVTVRWTQIAGAAADPDAGGGTYKVRFVH